MRRSAWKPFQSPAGWGSDPSRIHDRRGLEAASCVLLLVLMSLASGGIAAEPRQPAPESASGTEVDLGLFARVVTSDPSRLDGAKSGRLEPFREEDVFLTNDLASRPDGTYSLPAARAGRHAIGLEWAERRVLRRLVLEAVPPGKIPPGVEIQYWSSAGRKDAWSSIGQTPWQGRWERLPAKLDLQPNRLLAEIPQDAVPEFTNGTGVLKVRWLVPAGCEHCLVRRLSAFGPSQWNVRELLIDTESMHGQAEVAMYNGLLIDLAGRTALHHVWDSGRTLRARVVCSELSPRKADRTLLRFKLPAGDVTVAVEDVLNTDGVYVRDFGLLVRRADSPGSAAAFCGKIADRQTILARVRSMPDQSLDQAMRALWRPIQNNGPTMLSLACDNEKFILEREGALRYGRLSLRPELPARAVELVRLDFGIVGLDSTVRPPQAAQGLPLRIGDKTYTKGFGLHANAEVAVWLDGRYRAFEAEIGVLPQSQSGGTAVFQAEVDGRPKIDTGVMRQGESPRSVHIDLASAKRLVLRVLDAGDGILNDAANLAEARLLPANPETSPPVYLSDLFASQKPSQVARSRRLEKRWLPIVVNTAESGGIVLRQRTWVAPLSRIENSWETVGKAKSLGVAEFTLENSTNQPREVSFRLGIGLSLEQGEHRPVEMHNAGKHVLWTQGDRLLAALDVADIQPSSPRAREASPEGALRVAAGASGIVLTGRLSPASTRRVVACIPAWQAKRDEHARFFAESKLKENVLHYWQSLMAPAMQVELPEPLVEDVFRAAQVHCLMAARNEAEGRRVAPWCASDAYGPLDTEAQPVILGMGLVGQREFARRGLDYFIANFNADGALVKGYTLMGTGQHLWTLAEQYGLDPERRWLEHVAPQLLKSCRWILRQTEKTQRLDAHGDRPPEYSLFPPGVLADWDRYAYYFYANAHLWAGLKSALRLLDKVLPADEARELAQAAREYREEVLRAFRWQQSQMPVVPLRDGTFVPPCPSSLYCYGLTREFFGGISAIGHDVEAGGNHMIPLGLIEPKSRESDWIVNYLEDRWFLIDGIFGAYPAKENEADWFNCGGFAKLQPHYARTADIHSLRDDVKPFVRTYFNTLPVLLNRENLTFWEHMNNGGAWCKTHEMGWFLEMTRTMLLTERAGQLWLAPFVTTHWMKHGMHVAVRNAPTRFGPVSYSLRSAIAEGHIEATVESPSRMPPARLVLRVRHPEGKPMRAVTVDGQPHADFDRAEETVRLAPSSKPISVRITY